jgi:phage major head subunit gpT-like protein
MLINKATLAGAYTGFSTAFQSGLASATSMYGRIATTVTSTTRENDYGWLGSMPGFREWVGDRVIDSIQNEGYKIVNKDFAQTISVKRNDFQDDNLGIFAPMFQGLGQNAAEFADTLVFPLLKSGFTNTCYDGQYFFDTDHPVKDADGNTVSVSNSGGGSGTPWFLLDVSRPLKPIVYQLRQRFDNLVRLDDDTDTNVFMRKEYIYGSDGRANVGFGFWQMAYGSKQTLDAANYELARSSMMSFKRDGGQPLNINPRVLLVPPVLEGAARKIVSSQLVNSGESNQWAGTAEVMVCPWLS